MEIDLTPEQRSFVHLGIEQGRFQRPEDAVKDALSLWEERERARVELLNEIDAGLASLDCGQGISLDSDEAVGDWMEGVKQRGRARLGK
jgi:putative addiction module CopG family antidote